MSSINFYSRSVPENHSIWRIRVRQGQHEVLQLTFAYLTYSQLRRCMLVSKSWRKKALEELQARCSVRISREEHAKIVLKRLEEMIAFRVGNLKINSVSLKSPLINQLFLKVRHTLHYLKLESPVGIQERSLLKILNQLPCLTHLSAIAHSNASQVTQRASEDSKDWLKFSFLSDRYWEDGNVAKQVREETVVYLNIRHLHLDFGPHITFELTRILYLFPNLIELAIANVKEEPRRHFKTASILSPASTITSLCTLRHLSLRQYSNTSYTEKLLQTLMMLNMRLETLVLIFHLPTSSSGKTFQTSSLLLRQFAESQGESLQSLKLVQVEDDPFRYGSNSPSGTCEDVDNPFSSSSTTLVNYCWNFNYSSPSISLLPLSLPNLQILHVQKPLITNLAQVLNHFPQLRELSVQVSHGSNWQGMLPSRLEPHENIRRLKIDFIDSESFSRLGYCFPALQTLQLMYCDKSLFDVLADFVPYFNKGNGGTPSKINKENIFSCHQCHGIEEEVSYELEGKRDEVTQDASCFVKGTGAVNANSEGTSFPNNLTEDMNFCKPKTRKKHFLRNLTRLRLRACVHLPFENFVFLQRERNPATDKKVGDQGENCVDFSELEEGDEDVAEEMFTWAKFEALKREEFADLPLSSADDNESCSSA